MKIPMIVLENRFAHPDGWKAGFVKFLAANGVKISLPKTIAELCRYDQQVAASGVNEFFTGAVDENNTNMRASYTPPEAEHMVVLGIKLLDGVGATIQQTPWGYGASDAAVVNGKYTVETNGVTVIRNMANTAHNPNLTTEDEGMLWLSEPIVWRGQTDLDISMKLLSAPVANTNVRFEVWGVGTIS